MHKKTIFKTKDFCVFLFVCLFFCLLVYVENNPQAHYYESVAKIYYLRVLEQKMVLEQTIHLSVMRPLSPPL